MGAVDEEVAHGEEFTDAWVNSQKLRNNEMSAIEESIRLFHHVALMPTRAICEATETDSETRQREGF